MTGVFFISLTVAVRPKKIDAGLILGLVQFDTPDFPSPGNDDKYTAASNIPPEIVDRNMYVVA